MASKTLVEFKSVSSLRGIVNETRIEWQPANTILQSPSLRVEFQFLDRNYHVVDVQFRNSMGFLTNWTDYVVSNGKLYCDVYIDAEDEAEATGYKIKFQFMTASGRSYSQTNQAVFNNFLLLKRWNRVSIRLDSDTIQKEMGSSVLVEAWKSHLSSIRMFQLGLVHAPRRAPLKGNFWIRKCALAIYDEDALEQLVYPPLPTTLIPQPTPTNSKPLRYMMTITSSRPTRQPTVESNGTVSANRHRGAKIEIIILSVLSAIGLFILLVSAIFVGFAIRRRRQKRTRECDLSTSSSTALVGNTV